MHELELKIAEWRGRMMAMMSDRPEAVRELEEHLRDHIEVLRGQGVSSEEAFDRSVKRLGDAREISGEFGRLDSSWAATSRIIGATYGLLVVLMAALGFLVGGQHLDHRWALLRDVHTYLLSAGYLTVFGSGLIGAWVVFIRWRRPLLDGEHQALRRAMMRLVRVGAVLVPVGIILGMTWAAKVRGYAWTWAPTEVGALAVLVSTWMLLAVQLRLIAARAVRWVLVISGCLFFGQTLLWNRAVAPMALIFWLSCALIAVHGAMKLLEAGKKAEQGGAVKESS